MYYLFWCNTTQSSVSELLIPTDYSREPFHIFHLKNKTTFRQNIHKTTTIVATALTLYKIEQILIKRTHLGTTKGFFLVRNVHMISYVHVKGHYLIGALLSLQIIQHNS